MRGALLLCHGLRYSPLITQPTPSPLDTEYPNRLCLLLVGQEGEEVKAVGVKRGVAGPAQWDNGEV